MRNIKNINVSNKKILLRLDLDVPVAAGKIADATRLEETLPTVKWLLESEAKVTAIGHLGRPQGNLKFEIRNLKLQKDNQYSLKPVYEWYQNRLNNNPNFRMLENLRFDPGEEGNSEEFAKKLITATGAEIYVFEAFAVSHRKHASVVQIPKLLPTYMGMRFEKEIEMLQKVQKSTKKYPPPQGYGGAGKKVQKSVLIIGGAKGETKIPLLEKLASKFDQVLVGGRIPLEITKFPAESKTIQAGGPLAQKFKMAELTADKLDITEKSAREFAEIIMNAGTVVWNGPMGAFEKGELKVKSEKLKVDSHTGVELKNAPAYGTYLVAKAMNETKAFTVVGGGDTEAALTKFNLESGIDWISSGGGAMLTYLAEGTVAFLEGLK